jgi:hypothetical protein
MANTFVTGIDGRVRSGVANTNVGGLKSWRVTKTTTPVPFPHFEMTADADGNMYPEVKRGLSGGTVTAEGWMNTDAADATDSGTPGLSNGLTVVMDFILVKGTPFGFANVSVMINQIEFGTAIDANTGATFTMQGTVNGIAPKTGTVT